MVSGFRLFYQATDIEKAQHYHAVLSLRGVQVELCVTEQLNARFYV